MLRGFLLFLKLRRLRGRTLQVRIEGRGAVALSQAVVTLAGIEGEEPDGDRLFVPWASLRSLHWGEAVEACVAEARRAIAAVRSDGPHDPFATLVRAMRGGAGDAEAEPKPAIPPEEIERILDEERNAPC